jgi:hypothetical protein
MSPAGKLSRQALERLSARFSPAERAAVEAEIAESRARLAERHYRILAAEYRGAAIAARASFGRPGHDEQFERLKALNRACQSAHRAYVRAKLRAERVAAR